MEILFLGTSSGWPLPRSGCNCEICSSNDPKDKRLRPSVLVNRKILIDASPDIYHELRIHKVDSTQITHIFITHSHDDHIMGLYDLSHIYRRNLKLRTKNEEPSKIDLISTKGVLSHTRRKMATSVLAFNTVEVKPFEELKIGKDTSVWFIPVEHTVETYAIKIKSPKPIVYAPEFRKILPSSQKLLGDLDLAIIDGSSKSAQGQAKGHETIEEGIRLARDMRAKKIFFTNIGHKTDTNQRLANFVQDVGGNKFNIAFDGLEIKV